MSQDSTTWTVKAALDWTYAYLEKKGDAHALLSARFLLSHATGLSHLELYTLFDRPLSPTERATLHEGVARRAAGEPLQYISGHAPFRYLDLTVRPGVLIPRPETEILVGEAIERLRGIDAPVVADIGCGSGCIACAVATEVPTCTVYATDISSMSVELTYVNAHDLGIEDRLHVIECDLDAGIPHALDHSFDAVLSNPPYIPCSVMDDLSLEVKGFEPKEALVAGEDGLDVFRRLLLSARRLLKPGGFFAVELFESSLVQAHALAVDAGFEDVRIMHDLTDRPRVLMCWKGEDA